MKGPARYKNHVYGFSKNYGGIKFFKKTKVRQIIKNPPRRSAKHSELKTKARERKVFLKKSKKVNKSIRSHKPTKHFMKKCLKV